MKKYYFSLSVALSSLVAILVLELPDTYSSWLFIIKALSFQLWVAILVICLLACFKVKRPALKAVFGSISLVFIAQITSQVSFVTKPSLDKSFQLLSISALGRTRNGVDLFDFTDKHRPDLLCIQEIESSDLSPLKTLYPYIVKPPNEALAIASKYPLTSIAANKGIQQALLTIDDTFIQVINVHMSRPYNSNYMDESWQQLFSLAAEDKVTILCGDFNSTPHNDNYQLVRNLGYEDSHRYGTGLGFTFPHKQRRMGILGPQVRIDYIFSNRIDFLYSKVVNVSSQTDHKGVLAYLKRPAK